MKKTLALAVIIAAFNGNVFSQMENCKMSKKEEEKFITKSVEVKGLISKPFIITAEKIKELKLKVYEVKNTKVVCQTDGEVKKTLATFKGVLLKDIVMVAGIKIDSMKQKGAYYVLVTASDNYKVIFTYNELMLTTGGNNTYLIFEENGKPVTDDGLFVVMCTTDLMTGARHVKWVKEIEVKKDK
jgi:DMSO/TMAO reductase YedYZ molybdopterin-dependent catalytic subunit